MQRRLDSKKLVGFSLEGMWSWWCVARRDLYREWCWWWHDFHGFSWVSHVVFFLRRKLPGWWILCTWRHGGWGANSWALIMKRTHTQMSKKDWDMTPGETWLQNVHWNWVLSRNLEMLRLRHGYCSLHQEETVGCFAFLHQSEDEGVLSVNRVTCVTDW